MTNGTIKKLLESIDEVENSGDINSSEDQVTDQPVEPSEGVNEEEILDELNRLFTPVLVMQDFEQKVSDETNLELAEAAVLTERNMVQFDDTARMAQLTSVCALLIARKKNTEAWQLFKKAAAIKRQSKIDIQKQEYDQAKSIAQKYLVKVSTTNNSAVARKAASDLLPQTQH